MAIIIHHDTPDGNDDTEVYKQYLKQKTQLMKIQTETCDGKCDPKNCLCPATFEELFNQIDFLTTTDYDSIVEAREHAKRITGNYIRQSLEKSYRGDITMETSMTKEDIK